MYERFLGLPVGSGAWSAVAGGSGAPGGMRAGPLPLHVVAGLGVGVAAKGSQAWPESPGQLRRRTEAEALYRFEMILREMGLSDFVYDEEEDLFRFRDGRFAFSRYDVDSQLLWRRDHTA